MDDKEMVGCIVWDGCSMVAGSTTGGFNAGLPGCVGNSALLGCGVYVDERFGYSFTGHSNYALALGLTRQMANHDLSSPGLYESLQTYIDRMFLLTGKVSGAVVLADDSVWATYCSGTTSRMPFCFIGQTEFVCGDQSNCSSKNRLINH